MRNQYMTNLSSAKKSGTEKSETKFQISLRKLPKIKDDSVGIGSENYISVSNIQEEVIVIDQSLQKPDNQAINTYSETVIFPEKRRGGLVNQVEKNYETERHIIN